MVPKTKGAPRHMHLISEKNLIEELRMEVDSEECHNAAEADLPIAKKGRQIRGNR
ncbi:hypothetical protein B296_00008856 [Ensete ventricosum]|uniref:Uncharacterized protein n=1 Tax=Ensete ventricosum TaxID=4639 RepID=A0A427B3V3_ENSVE|nr:hypothetical protein B296_00008856 [Ensete ventricosum]